MTIRGVPEDLPDLWRVVDASAPGDRVGMGLGLFSADAAITVGAITLDHAADSSDRDVLALHLGALSLSPPGPTLFRATGDDLDTPVVGGANSGHPHGQGGGDVPIGGAGIQWIEGGPGHSLRCIDDAATAVGEEGRDRIAPFGGDQVVEDPPEGGGAVWAGAAVTLSGHSDVQGVDGACVAVHFEPSAGEERLFLDGAATWGRGDGLDGPTVGDDLDDRRAGRAGGGTLTGGAGDDTFRLLAIAPFRATVADFWPGAGSNDQSAASRGPSPSREQAIAALRRQGDDAWVVLEGRPRAVLRDSRLADPTPNDLLVV